MRDEEKHRKRVAQLFALLGGWVVTLGYAVWGMLRGMSLLGLAIRVLLLFGVTYGLLFAYFFWIMRHGVPRENSGERS